MKKGGRQMVSASTLNRHAHWDLKALLNAQTQDPRPEDVIDDEREGNLCDDMADEDMDVECADHDGECADHDVPLAGAMEDPMEDDPHAEDIFAMPRFEGWKERLERDPDNDELRVLVGELLLTFFEWMCVHKPTNECARAVHAMISLLVPPASSNFPEWGEVLSLLDLVYKNVVEEVDLCPNDHIAFVDATHPILIEAGYMHAHRTFCPKCGAARYKPENDTDHKVPVKRGYYFPIDTFVSSIFRDGHTKAHRQHTVGDFPPGHVRRSRGFYEKVTANTHMNEEPRNQAFIGMADGIPLFRSKKASLGVVVGALRQANQPDYISKMFGKVHLSFLYPCEYWVEDPQTKEQKLKKAKPSNLSPLIMLLVNDLLHWYDGKIITDFSMDPGDPARQALIRCILLFWCGDYPGLGEASNFSHSAASAHACHWCNVEGDHSMGLSRMVYAGYRRSCDSVHIMLA
jgi:hypothetical protein